MQNEHLTYSVVCLYFFFIAFSWYVFQYRQQLEEFLIKMLEHSTNIDVRIAAEAGYGSLSIWSKLFLVSLKVFLFMHGVIFSLLVAGVVYELIA